MVNFFELFYPVGICTIVDEIVQVLYHWHQNIDKWCNRLAHIHWHQVGFGGSVGEGQRVI